MAYIIGKIIEWLTKLLANRFSLKAEAIARIIVAVTGFGLIVLIFLIAGYSIRSCYVKRQINKTDSKISEKLNAAMDAESRADQIAKKEKVSDAEVRDAYKEAEKKQDEFVETANKELGSYSDSFIEAKKKFCALEQNRNLRECQPK